MSDETDVTSEVARVLRDHRIECTGLEGVTCRGCRERGWMSWLAYYRHQSEELAKSGLLVPQIAAQEPAGATQGGSGDSRASGGLGERLRALGTGQTRTLRKVLRAMADEADRLEEALRSTTHQLELEQDDVCVAHGTIRPCRHCAYAASASEGSW